jgi:hypothetical protein
LANYSCFLNVVIQIIYHTPELHDLFASNHRRPEVRKIHKEFMYMKGTLMCLAACNLHPAANGSVHGRPARAMNSWFRSRRRTACQKDRRVSRHSCNHGEDTAFGQLAMLPREGVAKLNKQEAEQAVVPGHAVVSRPRAVSFTFGSGAAAAASLCTSASMARSVSFFALSQKIAYCSAL